MTQLTETGLNFELTESQEAVAQLAAEIIRDTVTEDRQRELEQAGERDALLWSRLAKSGLLALGIAEERGGTGAGMLDLATLFVELGKAAAVTPAFPSLVAAAGLARLGGPSHAELLQRAIDGRAILTYARPAHVAAIPRATVESDTVTLHGTVEQVPCWDAAEAALVVADTERGPALLLLEAAAIDGAIALRTTSGGAEFDVPLDGIKLDIARCLAIGDEAAAADRWLRSHAVVALCALQVGAAEHILHLTAGYTTTREQFGRPIASFQAIQQRLADVYIDVEAMRWTMWQAAWALDSGVDAGADVNVAKIWAAEGGQRVMSACLHMHGGMGVDATYPLHRYYLQSKTFELAFGSSTEHLVELGRSLADAPPRPYAMDS